MHPVQIGTCGWSYKDWAGPFYPEGMKPAGYLAHYAKSFSIVEVDSTFYRTPALKTVETWRDSTPDDFGFSLKVPQVITHEKVLEDCDAELRAFLAAARLLGPKLRCCCLQFRYFNLERFAGLDDFLDLLNPFLDAWPDDIPVAMEVRNKGWMAEELADCLRDHNAVWVLPDQKWMPSPLAVLGKLDPVTGPFAYIRLLGDRDEVDKRTKTLNQTVVDRAEQIAADAEAIYQLQGRVKVLVFVNNHFAGYAHATIEQFRRAIQRA